MIILDWIRCDDGRVFCGLATVNLDNVQTEGVYVIWHTGNPSRVVRVGQGNIVDRLKRHRYDPEITQYAIYGRLLVTWAYVSPIYIDGVERYLAEKWFPLVGDRHPSVYPIEVNSPFE